MTDDFSAAFESDALTKKPIDEQIQSIFEFVQQHEKILDKVTEANCESILAKTNETHTTAIQISSEPIEKVLPLDILPETTQDHVRKVLIVLIYLADEVAQLKDIAESKFYHPLVMFGQVPISVPDVDNGKELANKAAIFTVDFQETGRKEKMMGRFLPFLQELSNFVERCYSVCLNLIQNLSGLYNAKNPLYRSTFKFAHLSTLFQSLAQLLTILLTLDSIIEQNELLHEAWSSFKSMIAFARNDIASFNSNATDLAAFEQLLVNLDQKLLLGDIFRNCIEQDFEALPEDMQDADMRQTTIAVRSNSTFLDNEYLLLMKNIIESSLSTIGTSSELFHEKYNVVGGVAMYCLYRRLLPSHIQPDSKLHKSIWGIQKTLPVVVLTDNVVFKIGEFINKHAYFEVKKLDPQNIEQHRKQHLTQFDSTFTAKATVLLAQCKAWMIIAEGRIQRFLCHETKGVENVLETYGHILLKAFALSTRIHHLAQSALVLHSYLQMPMSKQHIGDVLSLLEQLKAMQRILQRKQQAFSEFLQPLLRAQLTQILFLIQPIKVKFETISKPEYSQLVYYSLLRAFETFLKGTETFTATRQKTLLLFADLLMNCPFQFVRGSDKEKLAKLQVIVSKIVTLSTAYHDIQKYCCNTSFLYFHVDLLPMTIQAIYQNVNTHDAYRLHYLLAVFEDGMRLCAAILHDDCLQACSNYRLLLKHSIQLEIIWPLCRDIENDLRYHIHTKTLDHMQTINPKTENVKIFRAFLQCPSLCFLGIILNIREEITHYLDYNFYNLTTIALHDWRTYLDMRSLAGSKYGLQLMDNFLPMGSLEQGLDVLQIMRNIHIFVGRFTYNMNMQEFVEFRPDKNSKHCNTIKIQSIAASIRQHGLGVLNTTVNFTYQFLSSKFFIFSQFLFDEHIRRILSREHRFYRKHKHDASVNNQYPYDRATEVVKDIRKLGVNEQQKTFLDQFRILVTEIGNALGYVRMVRSASMFYCAEAIKYLPEFEDVISFGQYAGDGSPAVKAKTETATGGDGIAEGESAANAAGDEVKVDGANLTEQTVRAARNLDDCISTLVKNFGSGSDYFKILVNVFQSVLLNNENHDHLKNFYAIGKCLISHRIEYRVDSIVLIYDRLAVY
jgi:WASH complex subunit 7